METALDSDFEDTNADYDNDLVEKESSVWHLEFLIGITNNLT